MRVLHFIDYFFQPTQTFIKRYIEKSLEFGEVGIVSFKIDDVPTEVEHANLYPITGWPYSKRNITGATTYLLELATGREPWHLQMIEVIKQFTPDIIHCHFGLAGTFMMRFEKTFRTGIPFITSFYGYDISSQPLADRVYYRNLIKLFNIGTGFLAEGPALLKRVTDFGCPLDKCHLNPLLVPTNLLPVKNNFRAAGEPIKFLFVGRFMEKKGLHLFLRAMGKIKDCIPQFTIDIIGGGIMESVYRDILSLYNLDSYVRWVGMKPHSFILEAMKDYDFLIHPSLTAADGDSEGGAPTILIEAQAAGLPVIASRHADIPFVMGYDDFLAEENNEDSLTEIIKLAINHPNVQELSKKGIKKASLQHDFSTNTTYQNLLKNILSR